jgi:hypothetical protein
VERVRHDGLQAHTARAWGPALVFGRLWEQQGLPEILARLARGRRFRKEARHAAPRAGARPPRWSDDRTPGAEPAPTAAERVSRILLARSPLGALVRWVARLPVSVHAKLLAAFLLVVALFFAMGAASVRITTGIARQNQ